MKKIRLLLPFLLMLAACSGFQHAHYRKLDKVDATSFVSVKENAIAAAEKKSVVLHSRTGKGIEQNLFGKKKPLIRRNHFFKKTGKQNVSVPVVPLKKIKQIFPAKKPSHSPLKANRIRFGQVLFFGLLLASFFIAFSGFGLLIVGIILAEPLFMLAGALYFFIGGIPLWLVIRNLVLTERRTGPYESQR